MSIEQAIHEHWQGYQPLTRLTPANRFYTGPAPARDERGLPIEPPYVSLETGQDAQYTRTSSGLALEEGFVTFHVLARTLAEGLLVADALRERYQRAGFAWRRGQVLDMKLTGQTERPTAGGGWELALRFRLRATRAAG